MPEGTSCWSRLDRWNIRRPWIVEVHGIDDAAVKHVIDGADPITMIARMFCNRRKRKKARVVTCERWIPISPGVRVPGIVVSKNGKVLIECELVLERDIIIDDESSGQGGLYFQRLQIVHGRKFRLGHVAICRISRIARLVEGRATVGLGAFKLEDCGYRDNATRQSRDRIMRRCSSALDKSTTTLEELVTDF